MQGKSDNIPCSGSELCVMQAIGTSIVSRIYGNGRGWTFSQKDFGDLAGRLTADSALSRLEDSGTIRRVLRAVWNRSDEHVSTA